LSASIVLFYASSGLVYFVVYSVLMGILSSYTQSVWTLAYLRLPQQPAPVMPTSVENA
jgi:hypothetical protein